MEVSHAGIRNGEPVEESQVAEQADRLNVYAWSVRGLKDSTWHCHMEPSHGRSDTAYGI